MNHRQFRSMLCYRLAIPMFSEGSLCLSCSVHRMDRWGDHDVHCSSKVGVKFRHNLVRDILVDICSKVGIMDACLDVTCISPFAGIGATSWAHGVALNNVMEKKKRKYASICEENGYKFIPFAFFLFEEFDTEALDTLSHIKSITISQSNNAKSGAFIFHRVLIMNALANDYLIDAKEDIVDKDWCH
nr:beta-myrcene synthase [Tanacetum cinerariifolium]